MSSLLKSALHNSIAEGLFNELQNRSARYYYFLGKTLSWTDDQNPPYPIDSIHYENETRNEIITMKEIKSTDVAFVVPRVDWTSGLVWDMYDDQYSDEIQGVDLISGGYGYSDPPTVSFSGGGGSGASAVAAIQDGVVIGIEITAKGRGYTSNPTVTIAGGGGEGAAATAKVNIAYSGARTVENINCYVITDEFNVYKCLDNNNNAVSTYKPVGTVVDPVIMPDGYMWKYLYSIPIALRNKFLTDQYMPVVNALRGQFYSGGELLNTVIQSGGSGYTFATVTVDGDGFRESDPLLLQSVQLTSGGTGYTNGAICTIDAPFSANSWTASVTTLLGQKLEHNNNLYECARTGVTGTVGPSHMDGIVENGSASFKYIGTRATGTVNVTSGVVTSVSLKGMIYEINLVDSGLGYTSAPSINLTGGSGSGFVGQCIMRGTSVGRVYVSNAGSNYTSAPTVTFGTQWSATTALTAGQQVWYGSNLYTVLTGGTTSTTAPSHTTSPNVSAGSFTVGFRYKITSLGNTNWNTAAGTTGVTYSVGDYFIAATVGTGTGTCTTTTATNGTTKLDYVGRPATGTSSLKYGAGYSGQPNISISPVSGGSGAAGYLSTAKSNAKLTALVDGGQVIGVQIDEGGTGYTYANLTVNGDGTGAIVTADLSPGDIDTLQANTELLTIDGRVMAYPVTSGGFGYGGAPTVTITGDGTGAAATATVVNGSVTKINVTNYGTGYRWATVSIDGTGYGATARAIIAPYGGHGKDPINGMYARTLMFYSNISKDKNQGFDVQNDFRQVGIIKNPRAWGGQSLLKSALASACYVLTGSVDTVNFTQDMTLRLGSLTGKRFRIVTVSSTALLVQSIDNAVPTVGATFLNENSQIFSCSGVTAPTVDKYSGDLLFIDNKQAFTPTVDQTVTMRTVIKF